MPSDPVFECSTELVCRIHMLSEQPGEVIGATPAGFRVNGFITSGRVEGPRIQGIVRPVGCGDWAVIRPDDIADIDVRLTIETHDGALIAMTYTGICRL